MTDPTKHFDDELLSAYVDGELTDEQLAQVERRLADDPQAQQLVDELRALSQEIQSLPPQTVGEDLRATVMQRAERAMLLGNEDQQVFRPHETGSSRRWMWAVMALAATLLLSLYLPSSQQEEKPLASAKPAPDDSTEVAEPQLEAVEAEEPLVLSEENGLMAHGGGGGGVGGALADSADALDVDTDGVAESLLRAGMAPAGVDASKESLVQPDCQVFLTLNEGANGREQFHQLLLSNNITLEEANKSESSPLESATAGAGYATRRSSSIAKTKEPPAAQEEMVLVEATAEQIENLLEAYNADTQNFASLRMLAEESITEKSLSVVNQWQQWERSGKQLAQNKLQQFKRKKQAVEQSQRGRAIQLNATQFQRSGNGVLQFDRHLLAKNKTTPHPPMQVLFILQHSPTSNPGEPVSGGEAR